MNKEKIKYVDLNGKICYAVLAEGKVVDVKLAQHIVSITAKSEFNKISSLDIVFENATTKIEVVDGEMMESFISDEPDFELGKAVEFRIGYDVATDTVFKGKIVRRIIKKSGSFQFILKAKHEAEVMTKDHIKKCYESKKTGDIIKEICKKYELRAEVEASGNTYEQKIQDEYTDWDFINMIAESDKMIVFTTPEGIMVKDIDAKTLSAQLDKEPVIDIVNGYNINHFSAELDNSHSHVIYKADSFDVTDQENSEESSSSPNVSRSKSNKGKGEKRQANSSNGDVSVKERTEIMETLSVRNDLAFLTGEIDIVGYAPLLPGDVICLHKVGKGYDGKILVSSVTHTISAGKWSTNLKIGFEDVFYAERYDNIAPKPSQGMLPPVYGLQIAKVETLAGDPRGEGRIYVKLMNSKDVKLWCRVVTLDAGNMRGSHFIPEIGDEVVVGYIGGNANSAVILGMIHSKKAPVPLDISDENHVKGFFSRENIQLLFDDEKIAFSVETPKGNRLLLSEDEKGIALEDQNGNTIVMNDQGIMVESKKTLTLKAAQDVTIEGNNVNIKANAQLVAKGTASAEVSASGNTVIKGGMVQIN